ncbi:MAG: tetratricopeptide repeat protein [Planctomycetota bacterium]
MDFTKHLQKAEEAVRRRNYDFAIELYRQLLDLDADQEDARRGLRRAAFERSKAKKGGKLFRAIGGAVPLGKAKTLAKVGRFDAASKALEDYLAKSPEDEEANLLLGECLEKAGHLRSAKAVYEFLAEVAPKNPEGLKRAGAMMQATGDVPGALAYFERALAVDPRDQDALKARKNLAAEAALSSSRLDEVKHSREAVVDVEKTQELERSRRRHLTAEELEQERDRLEARFAEDPKDVGTMLALADVHEKLGDVEAALDVAERALDYRRDDYELVAKVGGLRAKQLRRQMARAEKDGDRERADELERRLLEHEVEDMRRRVALRPTESALALELAARLLRAGSVDEALGTLQKLPAEGRLAGDAAFLKARCFQAKGFADLAAKEFRAALAETSPSEERGKEILYNLGLLAEEQGDPSTARDCFGRVFEVDIAYRDVAQRMERLR